MRRLHATVDAETARQRLERARFPWLLAWLPRRRPPRPSHLELVGLPHWLVTFAIHGDTKKATVAALIGGHEATFALLEPDEYVWDEADDDAEQFEPALPRDEAIELARRGLLRVMLGRSDWGPRPELGELRSIERIDYPFWAYYFARRGGMLDVRLLDAVRGSPAGPKAKVALLAALAGKRSPFSRPD